MRFDAKYCKGRVTMDTETQANNNDLSVRALHPNNTNTGCSRRLSPTRKFRLENSHSCWLLSSTVTARPDPMIVLVVVAVAGRRGVCLIVDWHHVFFFFFVVAVGRAAVPHASKQHVWSLRSSFQTNKNNNIILTSFFRFLDTLTAAVRIQ